ncbi:MAG TPA: glycoside hydrolase family 3 N-terminal domain-containing protein [Ktedonobacteraceae bacterium]|nr:glycoside hydrolase family 3 N-terminal domain-containing protein [Ktedonobacteraceae bacterium]
MVPAYDPNEPASLSPVLIDQVLRGLLGYQGVVITDAMNGGGLLQFMQQQGYRDPAQAIAEATVRAILANDDFWRLRQKKNSLRSEAFSSWAPRQQEP